MKRVTLPFIRRTVLIPVLVLAFATSITVMVALARGSGDLTVEVVTAGVSQDQDGYLVTLDVTQRQTVASTGAVTFTKVSGGVHRVVLSGLADNCTASHNPQHVTVRGYKSVSATFAIACQSMPGHAVLVGAGDIARCSMQSDDATADLLDSITGTVFTVGDNVYDAGTSREYADCFHPTWGRHRSRTRPSPGNHDYKTDDASGYFEYFGASAGDPSRGYYSYDLGSWHVVVLNSNLDLTAGSPQITWLEHDLAANTALCTVAYWHHPRFSSGMHGDHPWIEPLWDALYAAGVEIVMNGHDHNYERFAPQTPAGVVDSSAGIRQFVVGTGGTSLRPMETVRPNSEVRNDSTHGVLRLTLRPGAYDWEFVPVVGQTFTDSGSTTCH